MSKKDATTAKKGLLELLEETRKKRALDRKRLQKLPADKRKKLLEKKAQQERGRFLMPEAPSKRNRKALPERVPCPISENSPKKVPASVSRRSPRKASPERVPCPISENSPKKVPASVSRRSPRSSPKKATSSCEPSTPPVPPAPTPLQAPPPTHALIISPSGITTIPIADTRNMTILSSDLDVEFCGFPPGSNLLDEENYFESWGQPDEASDVEEEEDAVPPNVFFDFEEELALLEAQDDSTLRQTAEEAGEDITNFDWREESSTFTGKKEVFVGPSGPTFPVDGETPLSIFERIFDQELMELLVRETNRYAHQLLASPQLPSCARLKRWSDTNMEEMWVFLCIMMIQGMTPLPVEKEYWAPKLWFLKFSHFGKIMPYSRFLLLKKCLHFVDNSESVGISTEEKRLRKIAPIMEILNKRFAELYLPAQEVSLDESLLLWKGRLAFAQLIAHKTAKTGVKSYELCESKTGYLWSARLYAGKGNDSPPNGLSDELSSSTSKIVFDLMRPLLGRGHVLVMDSFYNSPLLSRLLKRQRTDTMGTLRLNREFVPDSLKVGKSQLRQGEVAFSQTNDISIVAWHDLSVVALISTFHPVEFEAKEKHGRFKFKPKVVLDYNISMGGLDKKDQLLSAYPIERIRNAVWYKKVFRRLLNVAILNAHVIFATKNVMPARLFRQTIIENILARYSQSFAPSTTVIESRSVDGRRLLKGGHYIEKSGRKNLRCKWCPKHGRKTKTHLRCDTCLLPLCISCFKDFHTYKADKFD